MVKLKTFVEEARRELKKEKRDVAKSVIKERIREIETGEKTLKKLKAQYKKLLEKDVDDIEYE